MQHEFALTLVNLRNKTNKIVPYEMDYHCTSYDYLKHINGKRLITDRMKGVGYTYATYLHLSCRSFLSDKTHVIKIATTRATMVRRSRA